MDNTYLIRNTALTFLAVRVMLMLILARQVKVRILVEFLMRSMVKYCYPEPSKFHRNRFIHQEFTVYHGERAWNL